MSVHSDADFRKNLARNKIKRVDELEINYHAINSSGRCSYVVLNKRPTRQ